MSTATWSYFVLPGQSWFIIFRDCWPCIPWWLVDGDFSAHTQREQT